MIQAEISIYPLATKNTSVSFYITRAIETVQRMEDVRYKINPIGTTLESKNIDAIYQTSKQMTDAVHNLGINRVEVVIKIDSRRDKESDMEDKVDAVKRYLE